MTKNRFGAEISGPFFQNHCKQSDDKSWHRKPCGKWWIKGSHPDPPGSVPPPERLHFKGDTEIAEIAGNAINVDRTGALYCSSLEHGLLRKEILFHAQFKDQENIQSVRLFFVTAVLSALITLFLAFLIIWLFRKTHKEFEDQEEMDESIQLHED